MQIIIKTLTQLSLVKGNNSHDSEEYYQREMQFQNKELKAKYKFFFF